MAKLYAELTSDKGARVVSKSGDNEMRIVLRFGNEQIAVIYIEHDDKFSEHAEITIIKPTRAISILPKMPR